MPSACGPQLCGRQGKLQGDARPPSDSHPGPGGGRVSRLSPSTCQGRWAAPSSQRSKPVAKLHLGRLSRVPGCWPGSQTRLPAALKQQRLQGGSPI